MLSCSRCYKLCLFVLLIPCIAFAQAPDPLVAYGLRRIVAGYAGGAVEVRRSSDSATTTIGFTAAGDLNTNALESFASGSDCYVSTWYDQSGNGADLIQADHERQPLIASKGKVIRDEQNRPRLSFPGHVASDGIFYADGFSATDTPSISNQNLTAFFVQQINVRGRAYSSLLTFEGLNYYLGRDGGAFLSDGVDRGTQVESKATVQAEERSTQIVDCNGLTIRFFHERRLAIEKTHDEGGSGQTSFQLVGGRDVMAYSGYISEVRLYSALSDSDRISTYNDINSYFLTGPLRINEDALLPQNRQYHVDLYDWLKTVTLADVTTSPRDLEWDGTYESVEQLSNLYLIEERRARWSKSTTSTFTEIIRAEPKWYVLDDGNGAGIEGTGEPRFFRRASGTPGSVVPHAARWYSTSYPMANGGQGNPYYHDRAVGIRGLVTIAVEMMLEDEKQDKEAYWRSYGFAGGSMNGWTWGYKEFKHLVAPNVQRAFEEGFIHTSRKMLPWSPWGGNANITAKAIPALAHVYDIASNSSVLTQAEINEAKSITVRAVKKTLFGSETGTPETTDYRKGIYRKAGYIDEGDSPETTYNGTSFHLLVEAQSVTRGNPDWAFMEPVIASWLEFNFYQHFQDPDGRWDGPSGYAGRTGDAYVYAHIGAAWTYLTAADSFYEGRPYVRVAGRGPNRNQSTPPTVEEMASRIYVSYYNDRHIGEVSTAVPPTWSNGYTYWPTDNLFLPASGWYSRLRELNQGTHSSTFRPYQRSEGFSKTFDNEFWAYKGNDGTQDFGFFVETLEDPGYYDGWYGGSLQTFWAKETGIVLLTKHNKSGSDLGDNENTRVWSEIDRWGTHHIWGKDENGGAFSTAATDRSAVGSWPQITKVAYDNSGSYPSVDVETTLGPTHEWVNTPTQIFYSDRGEESEEVLEGTATFTRRFKVLPNGLHLTHVVTSDQADRITELWATLPVFLRNEAQEMPDTTIEYWDRDAWHPLGTELTRTKKLRLGRDFGEGPKYAYVVFNRERNVKLSSAVWQKTYQQIRTRLRNVHIDLHGSPGTAITFPSEVSLRMAIRTTNEPAPGAPMRLRRVW